MKLRFFPLMAMVLAACVSSKEKPAPVDQCEAGQQSCAGLCVDTGSDLANCGGCGLSCPTGGTCVSGRCEGGGQCNAGLAECSGACVDLTNNTTHCGACGMACGSGESCVSSRCQAAMQCTGGQMSCGGQCVDVLTSSAHCGTCGKACGGMEQCISGMCQAMQKPPEVCMAPISAEDTSNPTTTIGDGTAASCTFDKLSAAMAMGGTIVFNCGDTPVTIMVTETLNARIDRDTIVDGGGKVILDGGGARRIFRFWSDNYRVTRTRLVLQRLVLQNGQAPADDFTPRNMSNPDCAWGYKDGQGGAIIIRDGRLHLIDTVFRNNMAAMVGPDTGGGAIYGLGALEVIAVGSRFEGNQGSNGGAIYLLQTDGLFFDTTFENNQATGEGKNFGGASGCPDFNHEEQGGAGGNAGALGIDGGSTDRVELCGVRFINNRANELGTVFRTPNSQRGRSTFDRCLFDGNHAGSGGGAIWTQDMEFEMRASAIINNTSNGHGAGIRVDQGGHGSTLLLENTTFYKNVATNALGGGLSFTGPGLIRNCTFAENEAAGGEGFFGAALVALGDASQLEVYNTIFSNNVDYHEWTPMTCAVGNAGSPGVLTGAQNIQWPMVRNGPNNVEDSPCATNISFADPQLQPLMDNGGPTPSLLPGPNSPARTGGTDCPAADQHGKTRQREGCALGAAEP